MFGQEPPNALFPARSYCGYDQGWSKKQGATTFSSTHHDSQLPLRYQTNTMKYNEQINIQTLVQDSLGTGNNSMQKIADKTSS